MQFKTLRPRYMTGASDYDLLASGIGSEVIEPLTATQAKLLSARFGISMPHASTVAWLHFGGAR